MMHNDAELQGAQERIVFFSRLAASIRHIEKPVTHLASGYLIEIEKMHAKAMAYLHRHTSEPMPTQCGVEPCQEDR